MPNKLDSIIIFITSIIACIFFIKIENFLGIDYKYHPDALHYLKYKIDIAHEIYLSTESVASFLKSYFGRFFYFWVDILNYNPSYIIFSNIIFFAITNVVIFNIFNKKLINFDYLSLLLLIAVLFMPYRLHLSAHVLKETMMIFFFSLCFLRIHYLYKILPIIFIFYLRKFSLIYFLIFFNLNKIFNYFQINIILKLIILLFLLIVGLDIINELFIFHYESNLIEQVTAWSQKNMGGRDYDNITNFKYYHAYGVLLKAFIWPILFLSGSFVFFSFNFYFLILAVEIIVINILFYKKYKKLLISAEIYIVLFFISFHVSTFTAYFRYSYIAFILIIFYKLYYLENEKKNK